MGAKQVRDVVSDIKNHFLVLSPSGRELMIGDLFSIDESCAVTNAADVEGCGGYVAWQAEHGT